MPALDLPNLLARLLVEPHRARPEPDPEVQAAIAQAKALRDLPREHRAMVVRNSPQLHCVAFAEQLLVLAAQAAGDGPGEALALLDAFEIVADLPAFDRSEHEQSAIAELSAIALVRRAVNLTKLGDLAGARIVLDICRELEFTTVEAAAEYCEARAHHASVRLEVEEALVELAKARTLYESIGDEHRVGAVLVAQAFAYGEARNFPASVEALLAACGKVDPARDRRLALALCFNLARAFRDAGRSADALETIELTREFVLAAAGRLDLLHLRWLEAALLADRGYLETAASVYLEVATGFGELALAIELSEVALEAVETFTLAGRGLELVPLLVLAERVLRANGFDGERLAAWLALQNQVARQIVTAGAIAAARKAAQSG